MISEIEQMKRAAAAAGRICMPGHNYIYEAGMARTRELVETGALGRIISAYVMYNIHHPEEVAARYPGVIRQILTHHSYVLLYLAGRPRRLAALKATLHYARIAQEDIAMVQMELESGALAHFCASFAADDHSGDPWTVMVKLIGTSGSTRYSYRDWVETRPGTVHSQTYTAYQGSITNEVWVQGALPPHDVQDHVRRALDSFGAARLVWGSNCWSRVLRPHGPCHT